MTIISHTIPEDEYSPKNAQRELYELIIKAARRCAHDLAHCADNIPPDVQFIDSPMRDFFRERSKMWIDVFYMEDGKAYRHKLHNVIDDQWHVIEKYRELVKKHGLDNEAGDFDEQLPF